MLLISSTSFDKWATVPETIHSRHGRCARALPLLARCVMERSRWKKHVSRLVLVFWLPSAAMGASPVIDGVLSEWKQSERVTDAKGDATQAFDILSVTPRVVGSQLFLRLQIDKDLNLQSGNSDDGTLIIEVDLPQGTDLVHRLSRTQGTAANQGHRINHSVARDKFCQPPNVRSQGLRNAH